LAASLLRRPKTKSNHSPEFKRTLNLNLNLNLNQPLHPFPLCQLKPTSPA
jgi:hypothetical protein